MYLQHHTQKADRELLCDRLFLHESLLGMWDPENRNKALVIQSELPADLQACLGKLAKDVAATEALRQHRENEQLHIPLWHDSKKLRSKRT